MRGIPWLFFEGSQAAAFLIVVASLAPRVSHDAPPTPAQPAAAPAAVVAEPPQPVHEPVPPAGDEPRKDAPRLAIGFDPIADEPLKDAPGVKGDPVGRVLPPIRAQEPAPIQLRVRRELANAGPRIHRPFDSSVWVGPKVIVLRGENDNAQVEPRRVPPPPRPEPRRADSKHLEKHTLRQYWERDVEQFRALAKAGYKADAMREVFGAKYPHLRSAANNGIPLATLPPPPDAYIEALNAELARSRL